jgi:hypothetical protein
MSYDSWKLATPPEYEQGDPPDADEPEPEETICEECRTVTLADFVQHGRCEECAAPIEEAVQASLYDRLIAARNKAALEKRELEARKLQMWADQVQKIEVALVEMEDIKF